MVKYEWKCAESAVLSVHDLAGTSDGSSGTALKISEIESVTDCCKVYKVSLYVTSQTC